MRDSTQNLKTIVATTLDGRLVRLWDERIGQGWRMDFPG